MLKSLVLQINDARVFYNLQKKLKLKGIPFYILYKSKLPQSECLIVSDFEGIQQIQKLSFYQENNYLYTFLNYENFPNYKVLYIHIIKTLHSIDNFDKLTVAIDTGEKYIGVAYFLDNILLSTDIFYNLEEMIDYFNLYIMSLKPNLLEIKIGNGSVKPLRDTINHFLNLFNQSKEKLEFNNNLNFNIYLIDEEKTSCLNKPQSYYYQMQNYLYSSQKLSKHEKAAIMIGLRDGIILDFKSIEKIFNRKFTNAEIKRTQDISRRKTNGLYSISREMALQILEGKISMDYAIELQIKKNSSKNKQEKINHKNKE